MAKVLLLNASDEVLAFISERKALRLLIKDKAETISIWENQEYRTVDHIVALPAILKMKYYVRRNYCKIPFSRKAVLKRDQYICGYCLKLLVPSKATIDHIVPKNHNGQSCFTNCITACQNCNAKKRNRTPIEAGMILMKEPFVPNKYYAYLHETDAHHMDWKRYLTGEAAIF